MRTVKAHIEKKQHEFERHPVIERLRGDDPTLLARLAPRLTFWVMVFQDILRKNEQLVTDPALKRIARHHRAEDTGHDRWFWTDLAALGVATPSVADVFDRTHEVVRLASYALASEVYLAPNDACRITLLLAIESAGHVFFEAVASHSERTRAPGDAALKYFSRFHIDVEKKHALFEEQVDAYLSSLVLPVAVREQAHAMVDRCYRAFIAMFDEIERRLADATSSRPSSQPSSVRSLALARTVLAPVPMFAR
ncbi:MAG TPA: hypothetical protein VF765_21755 [Polyangiaceae bacterium]